LINISRIFTFLDKIDFSFFTGKKSETLFLPFKDAPNIIFIGLGKEKEIDGESIRNSSAKATDICKEKKIKKINLLINSIDKFPEADMIQFITEGISLSNYSFDRYKSNKDGKKTLLETITVSSDIPNLSKKLKDQNRIMENTLLCRDLINEITEITTPNFLAKKSNQLAKLDGVTTEIFGKSELKKLKMGLLLAVNKGSKVDPKLIVIKYTGNPKSKKYISLVGKGITFDSGGLNLKPTGSIETMKLDMAGAASVFYTIKTAAELKLKNNIYAIIPTTDNMLSNDAYRPGDIFTAYNGKTVEIGNTDAEGRLILADALAYTEKNHKPEYIIDLATLTGATLVALGETIAAYFTDDDILSQKLFTASESTGDKIWKLPLYSEFNENMESEIADLNNSASGRSAGTINGAIFLKNFIEKTKWAHIDIAGTSWYSKNRGYRPKNATGYGVRLLIELIKSLNI
jgi:leucyl aminopeptidase